MQFNQSFWNVEGLWVYTGDGKAASGPGSSQSAASGFFSLITTTLGASIAAAITFAFAQAL